MSNFFQDALNWAQGFRKDTNAALNLENNRRKLMERMSEACSAAGFAVEIVRQDAVLPALEVAVRLGDLEHSAMVEKGGDAWFDIVFSVLNQLSQCDEATVFLQLEGRDARAFICCTEHHDGQERPRHVTILNVVDTHNLVDAYKQATQDR